MRRSVVESCAVSTPSTVFDSPSPAGCNASIATKPMPDNTPSPSASPPPPLLSDGTKDYLAGVWSGIGKVVAGHPFDTVKARVQTGSYSGSIDALQKLLRSEGPTALYQGMTAPLFSVCFVGGILFYCNGKIRSVIQSDATVPLTFAQMFLAGAGAGLVVGLIIPPIEVIKLRFQVANKHSGAPPSIRAMVSKIGARNLFAGFTPTLLREVGTFGLFFPINESMKKTLMPLEGKQYNLDVPSLKTRIFAAGIGGILAWLPCYPIDQVKSHMQLSGRGTHRSMFHCAKHIYVMEGWRHGFFKGLGPCLSRAFPAYAAQYIMYEQAVSALQGW
jgi:solute carrier family 25 (mitochondrial carnitine/acylcarnitine transporter), member 20/29